MVTGLGLVTVPGPDGVPFGVTVTMYVWLDWTDCVFADVLVPPHATNEPLATSDNANINSEIKRLRRNVKGAPNSTAQKIAVPLFHGSNGSRFAAFALAAIVSVDVAVPPGVSVTELALAVTSAGVPSVELTAVVNETVPA
jgi:hypothetical protein